ncbi:precursor of dehydrogenase pyruvate dehydrogenase E1, alpha and beta subunits [Chaetoceros tenuissimus]|uniref:Precursor of dehydrogenase pyruvate dehydrogenase E1, alpha and beta subunits n=1 Tax=Chaetoceros tenuissimus TaxID=426638 RepID=A0AAD3D7K7_9STRA|nr:precursor of dehydrogenase pyruvate dehydrogenase E1, alpha and beta subunits [Chaetoceros tenuissimus]
MYFRRTALVSAICAASVSAFSFAPKGRSLTKAFSPNVAKYDISRKMSSTATEAETAEDTFIPMRPPIDMDWAKISEQLTSKFGYTAEEVEAYNSLETDKDALLKLYNSMNMARAFENACNQAYMQGKIRGFMHLDNGQESIPGLVDFAIKNGDMKYSYYREHTHAIASGVDPGAVMAELMMKETGTCKGAGGSMHIFDKSTYFQGGWALVAEQLPYAAGAAKSILLDRALGLSDDENIEKQDVAPPADDDRISVVFVGEGGSQNGRMAEILNAASKDNLPLLILTIDNGRAINTFTPDIAKNSNVYEQGEHYGVPGLLVDGLDAADVAKGGKAVIDYIRSGKGPAMLQVHTYRFNGHSPADPEHERGRKDEKAWARADQDPIKAFEEKYIANGIFTEEELKAARKATLAEVKAAVKFADESSMPPVELAKELEYPDAPDTDYNQKEAPAYADAVNARTISPEQMETVQAHISALRAKAEAGEISIGDAINLAIHEEMLRDPRTTIHAEDLQAGSSYDIPKLTQQTYGQIRAADEIIDEGHFIGKALGEAMNGYRPIVELMNTNFGIYGMPEISSAGNTYATTGGQFDMPMTIVGAGGTAPNQALGAEHSQPLHAYVMGIPGLKICTAASPDAAYGITKSMIRDNGPCFLFAPVKMMKESKGKVDLDKCSPLNKAALLHEADEAAVNSRNAVTVLTYLHGVKEAQASIDAIKEEGFDVDLIELRALKPLDMDTIAKSLARTNKLCILDESTKSGGVGATISAQVSEELFDLLDAPVKRLCMDDAPVPYAETMEKAVVKRGSDLIEGVFDLCTNKW